ncbi:OLC1v1015697C1, partial [Oldenlandia corymbosa var. corymbosa]
GCTTSEAAWTALQQGFGTLSYAQQTQLVMELHSLQKGDLSVTDLLSKAKGIADTLQLAGHRISPAEFNAIIFRKLGAEFNGIIGALQQRSEPPSYQDLLGQLVSYEVLLHAQRTVLHPHPCLCGRHLLLRRLNPLVPVAATRRPAQSVSVVVVVARLHPSRSG